MRIIFLDVDGVLNCQSTTDRVQGFLGIDSELLSNLAELVEQSSEEEETQIVLSSSWRVGQDYTGKEVPYHYQYLKERLKEVGLTIYDDTPYLANSSFRGNRGQEITEWLSKQLDGMVTGYVVLDDEVFPDFEEYGIMEHLVKTHMFRTEGGLREKHVYQALEVLEMSI